MDEAREAVFNILGSGMFGCISILQWINGRGCVQYSQQWAAWFYLYPAMDQRQMKLQQLDRARSSDNVTE
ncbi:hypothetical protein K469DRAFT_701272 [Zopfia rhizophila CBS 207.26]|uniref:Uncharacterized protein n=1 Tax=Zopfia rhizophila CBS 207.26 TaxID=1314779 RepID=A0A6A6DCK9_9PEZI|nr:hypothetical protein K469DRAFT_701272 [Zopfia rhizophila CBS 207.26]